MAVASACRRSVLATALAILLALPSAGLARTAAGSDDWHSVMAALQPGTALDIHLKDGQRINGQVEAVADGGVLMEYRSHGGVTHRLVSFDEMQTVLKPGVRRWWQKTRKVVAVVVLVVVAVYVAVYAAGGGGQ